MRVIAGEFRSRRLKTLPDDAVRPTPDRLRESLFNIIAPVVPGSVFLDAYAGSGAVGIEALSRGARHAIFIEKSREAVQVIEDNLEALGLHSRASVRFGPVLKRLGAETADIVFLDPPYELENDYALALEILGRDPSDVLVIAQHSCRFRIGERYGQLVRARQVRQGDNTLSFYRAPASAR